MEPSDHIDPPNPPMDPEQQAVADSLSDEFIQKIDDELLSHSKIHNRKVAMLVMLAMSNPELRVPGLPDLFYAQRVIFFGGKGSTYCRRQSRLHAV